MRSDAESFAIHNPKEPWPALHHVLRLNYFSASYFIANWNEKSLVNFKLLIKYIFRRLN